MRVRWRVARCLETLLEQLNEMAPKRSKVSDGAIGDADHQNRASDHNPHCAAPDDPTVTARDFTHDPDNGADMNVITERLRKSQDKRIKYVIWNKRMFSSYPTSTHPAWTWRPYSGPNLHTVHAHVSVQCNASKDSTEPWKIEPKEPRKYVVTVSKTITTAKEANEVLERMRARGWRGTKRVKD